MSPSWSCLQFSLPHVTVSRPVVIRTEQALWCWDGVFGAGPLGRILCWLSSSLVIRILLLWHALLKNIKKCNLCNSDISTNHLIYNITIHITYLSSCIIWLFLQIDLKKRIPVHSVFGIWRIDTRGSQP